MSASAAIVGIVPLILTSFNATINKNQEKVNRDVDISLGVK